MVNLPLCPLPIFPAYIFQCKLIEVVESSERVYLVMQYAACGDMLDYINTHNPMPSSDIRRYFLQMVAAVNYCHSQNVVHRDLKCENLLLDHKGQLLVTDFGFATTVAQLTDPLQTHCGSFAYAAPEVLAGLAYQGCPADVWSLGVVLYAMASGRLPYPKSGCRLQPPSADAKDTIETLAASVRHLSVPRHLSKSKQDVGDWVR